jgi:hypothetical protein
LNTVVAIGVTALVALAVANLGVSLAVIHTVYYTPVQKLAQLCCVWLLPLVGVITVGVFLYSQRDNAMFDTRTYPEPREKAVALTVQESIQGHDHAS